MTKLWDWLRGRFGNNCVQRAVVLQDKAMAGIDAKADHIIHPVWIFLIWEAKAMKKMFVGVTDRMDNRGKNYSYHY